METSNLAEVVARDCGNAERGFCAIVERVRKKLTRRKTLHILVVLFDIRK
jgi:hypothetical protein